MALDNDVKRLDQASGTTTPQTTSPAKQDDASASTSTSTSGSSTAGSLFTSDQNSTQTTSQPKASSSGSVFTDAKEAKKTETATAQNTGSAEPKKPKKEKDFTEKEVIDFINSLDKALPEKEKIKLIKKCSAIFLYIILHFYRRKIIDLASYFQVLLSAGHYYMPYPE